MPSFRDVIDIIIRADGSVASKAFKGVGSDADKAAKQIGPSGPFGKAVDGISKRSPVAAAALEKMGITGATATAAIAAGAATAGLAVAGFVAKSVNDFQKLALESGKLADKTGLAVDEASRWIEVGNDVGVSAQQMSTAFGMLAKNVGKNPEKFAALGITAQDTNGKILQAIDVLNRTPDASKRAALGAELFGRSWGEMAELIGQGSDEVAASLAKVSDAKVVTAEELANARKFRQAMDDLSDQAEDLALTIGGALVPALSAAVSGFVGIINAIRQLPSKLPDWLRADQDWLPVDNLRAGLQFIPGIGPLISGADIAMQGLSDSSKDAGDNVRGMGARVNSAATDLGVMAVAAEKAKLQQAQFNAVMDNVAAAKGAEMVTALSMAYNDAATAATRFVQSQLAVFDSALAAENALDAVETAAVDLSAKFNDLTAAEKAHGKGSAEARAATEAFSDSARGARGDILSFAAAEVKAAADARGLKVDQLGARESAQLHNAALDKLAATFPGLKSLIDGYRIKLEQIPPTKSTDVAVSDNGSASATQRKINGITGKSVAVLVNFIPRGSVADLARARIGSGQAAGGRVAAGVLYPINERGKEGFIPSVPGRIVPAHEMGGGGGTMNVTINMPPGSDGADVVRALETYKRRGGGPRIAALV